VQVGATRARLPRWLDRSGRFTALVHDEVRAVRRRWADELGELAVRVEDVPPEDDEHGEGVLRDGTEGAGVALALARPGLLVVYRRPLELRAEDEQDLADLVHEVVVDALAELLGVDPDEVDPDQG